MPAPSWFAVRSVFRRDRVEHGKLRRAFEERVVLFRATSFEEALAKGETEARRYEANLDGGRMLDHLVAYNIHDADLQNGDEVWSCVRDLDREDEDYLRQVYEGETESLTNVHLHGSDG